MAILVMEWQGVIDQSWNSKRPLVFAHVVLTKTLGVCRARETRAHITRQMYLWERGIYAGLVRYYEAEGDAREGRAVSSGKEEDEVVSRSNHDRMLSDKLRHAVRRATVRGGGGGLLPDDQCTNTERPVV